MNEQLNRGALGVQHCYHLGVAPISHGAIPRFACDAADMQEHDPSLLECEVDRCSQSSARSASREQLTRPFFARHHVR